MEAAAVEEPVNPIMEEMAYFLVELVAQGLFQELMEEMDPEAAAEEEEVRIRGQLDQ
jgi:hypothetical protein